MGLKLDVVIYNGDVLGYHCVGEFSEDLVSGRREVTFLSYTSKEAKMNFEIPRQKTTIEYAPEPGESNHAAAYRSMMLQPGWSTAISDE